VWIHVTDIRIASQLQAEEALDRLGRGRITVFDMPGLGVFWRWMGRPASETRCLSGLRMYIARIEVFKNRGCMIGDCILMWLSACSGVGSNGLSSFSLAVQKNVGHPDEQFLHGEVSFCIKLPFQS